MYDCLQHSLIKYTPPICAKYGVGTLTLSQPCHKSQGGNKVVTVANYDKFYKKTDIFTSKILTVCKILQISYQNLAIISCKVLQVSCKHLAGKWTFYIQDSIKVATML